jgi:hypothetical protein
MAFLVQRQKTDLSNVLVFFVVAFFSALCGT